jgi:SAM-dependent methyltransferase
MTAASVSDHYERILSPVYAWMVGGVEAAFESGTAELEQLDLRLPAGARVVDLGAGFGMHAIPLARMGARVLAIDSSASLLAELDRHSAGLTVQSVRDDLLSFRSHVQEKADAILCMGDTLTHLPEHTNVDYLIQEVADLLAPDGRFVLSFRDYTTPLEDEQRFIPVRSDERRILTCFLDYDADMVTVYDILYEREGDAWETRVSSYRKLRVAPDHVIGSLESLGFEARRETGARGMVRIVAEFA